MTAGDNSWNTLILQNIPQESFPILISSVRLKLLLWVLSFFDTVKLKVCCFIQSWNLGPWTQATECPSKMSGEPCNAHIYIFIYIPEPLCIFLWFVYVRLGILLFISCFVASASQVPSVILLKPGGSSRVSPQFPEWKKNVHHNFQKCLSLLLIFYFSSVYSSSSFHSEIKLFLPKIKIIFGWILYSYRAVTTSLHHFPSFILLQLWWHGVCDSVNLKPFLAGAEFPLARGGLSRCGPAPVLSPVLVWL